MWLVDYSLSTALGKGVGSFVKVLFEGRGVSHDFVWPHRSESSAQDIREHCSWAIADTLEHLSQSQRESLIHQPMGLILVSTKGAVDDWVWTHHRPPNPPLSSLLDGVLDKFNLQPALNICVSNACASSAAGLWLAQFWLKQNLCKHVMVVAADRQGAFVTQGFQSLRIVSTGPVQPFARNRSGLRIGDAAAVVLLSSVLESAIQISGVELITEGSAVTRPNSAAPALRSIAEKLKESNGTPELICAHATATLLNDQVESEVFHQVVPDAFVTGTKWCVGHTMAASGLVDVVATSESLKAQKIFGLATTSELDPKLQGRFALETVAKSMSRAWVSSLGFGGTNGMVALELRQ